MKAARFHGKEDLRIEEVPEPGPGPGQVKPRNAFAGICGSDFYFFYPEPLPFSLDEPHPLTGAALPQILGHEFSGTVVETGEGVTDVRVGDRCAVFPLAASCGTCTACRRGLPFSCRLLGSLGSNAEHGRSRDTPRTRARPARERWAGAAPREFPAAPGAHRATRARGRGPTTRAGKCRAAHRRLRAGTVSAAGR
ncbi:alcohol dehydrogenase catalytic domain-containing protein [Streptomyces sp. NPDC001274]